MLPSQFMKKYLSIPVHYDQEWKYIAIRRYLSGEPRKKNFNKQALWDFETFIRKAERYKPENGNFTGHHEWHAKFFLGEDLTPNIVPISLGQMKLCFYGKGSPLIFKSMLHVVSYYLKHADLPLRYLGWSHPMTIEEYAYWYLGLDCNGFAGEYYAENFPSVGIDGNDHINFLKDKPNLKVRNSFAEIKAGDLLVREGSDGGDTRHVAVIEHCYQLTDKTASVVVVQSAHSRDGLWAEGMVLESISDKKEKDGYGLINWSLQRYHKFHYVLGPV